MGIVDFLFKKKQTEEPKYDVTDIKLKDLDIGFVFEYDMKTWIVESIYDYDWGNGYYSKEYKVNNGEEVRFLSVEEDDVLYIVMYEKAKVRLIKEDLPEYILENDKPPKTLDYKDIKFYYEEESIGSFKDSANPGEDSRFISWDYYDEEDKFTLSIEQWDEEEFDASFGVILKEYQVYNILPRSK